VIRFQQYYRQVPIVPGPRLTFGYMELRLQQGNVTSYDRSLLILADAPDSRSGRSLPGGDALRSLIDRADYGYAIVSLFPAYRPELAKDAVTLRPVWAARLADGSVRVVAESSPADAGP
jgi:regulatory protein YycH of two-component signal transduction system YycFG